MKTGSGYGPRLGSAMLFLALITAALRAAAGESGAITLTMTGGAVPPGGLIALRLSLAETATPPSSLVVKCTFDTSRLSVHEAVPATATGNKAFAYRQTDSGLVALFYGGDEALRSGELAILYLEAAAGATTGSVSMAAGASSASDSEPRALAVTLATSPISIAPLEDPHSADTNTNGRIDLSELLRVIQLYNAGGFGCDAAEEDGYTPGGSDQGCTPHTLDYLREDWHFNLSELLRCIQFFNSFKGAYHADATGEDGYAPGLE
jgi:hypothetical protein